MSTLPLALLGRRTAKGLTIAALAVAATLATLAFAAAILLGAEADRIDRLARGLTIAVSDADPALQAARAARLGTMLAHRADLERIVRIEGPAPAPSGEPPAAIVEATLRHGHDERALDQSLAGQPGIAVVREGRALDPLAGWLRDAATAAILLLLAALAAVAPIAMLGVRAMLGSGSGGDVLAMLRRLGADDRQIAALVHARVVREALLGGLAGLGVAALAILFIAARAMKPDDGLMMPAVDPWSWTMLLAVPPLVVGLAWLGAETAARARVARHATLRPETSRR